MSMGRLFGTDGVRGVANVDLSPELVLSIGAAAADFFGAGLGRKPRILVGTDTRISSDMLEAAICSGICSGGGNAVRLGVVTTPAVAYLVRTMGADAGVMISASHNPFEYNGIKFFSRDGYKLPDESEDRIESLVKSRKPIRVRGAEVGRVSSETEAIDHYIDYLTQTATKSFRGVRMVIDCANGAASAISPRTFRRLGAEVYAINNNPDGVNINVNSGSTDVAMLQRAVLAHEAHVGLAHDGDADRLKAVDETGKELDGDYIMAICGLQMLRRGTLKHNTLVATVMSNIGLDIAFRKAGGRVVKTTVGDRYVLEMMRREGYTLGGEQSGHIIFSSLSTTGDGILTGIQLINVMRETNMSLSRLSKQMQRLPQVLVNVAVDSTKKYEGNARISIAIEDAEEELLGRGRILVRASGTEPLIRVMVEAESNEQASAIANRLAEVIKTELQQ